MMKNSRTKIELLQSAIIIGDSIWWDKEEGGGGTRRWLEGFRGEEGKCRRLIRVFIVLFEMVWGEALTQC